MRALRLAVLVLVIAVVAIGPVPALAASGGVQVSDADGVPTIWPT